MKTLSMWKKEIDEWIAKWEADIKAGRTYEWDENFIKNIKDGIK
jgi:hypothetical protein